MMKNVILAENRGELRADGYQVVGVGSVHPNGKKYVIRKDLPIEEISSEEIQRIIKPHIKEEKIISGSYTKDDLKKNIELNERFRKILEEDEKVKRLYEGDFTGYELSVGGELALVCFLIQYDFDEKEIFSIMPNAQIGRWGERGISYRKETYKKAMAKMVKEKVLEDVEELDIISDEEALDYNPPPKNWLIENVIPEKEIGLLVGKRGERKTFTALFMAICIASGKECMGEKIQGGEDE